MALRSHNGVRITAIWHTISHMNYACRSLGYITHTSSHLALKTVHWASRISVIRYVSSLSTAQAGVPLLANQRIRLHTKLGCYFKSNRSSSSRNLPYIAIYTSSEVRIVFWPIRLYQWHPFIVQAVQGTRCITEGYFVDTVAQRAKESVWILRVFWRLPWYGNRWGLRLSMRIWCPRFYVTIGDPRRRVWRCH